MEFMFQVLVSLCLINFTVESELICSQRPIIAQVGDNVILPCHLEPPINTTNETVVWSRPDLNPPYVHYHQDGQLMIDHQHSDYHLRTSLFMDGLTDGNVSMKIFRVKLSDAGTYSCSLPSMKKEASIQLIVRESEVICSHEPVIAAVGDDVILPCHLEPPSDVTTLIVEWKQNGTEVHLYHSKMDDLVDQGENFRGRTSLFYDEIVKGNISLKLINVTEQDAGNYTCFVSELNKRGNVTLINDQKAHHGFAELRVGSELICSQRPIVALVGDDVILPSHLDPPISATYETVVWTRPDLDPPYIHYHQDGQLVYDYKNPDYFYRTRLFMDEMTKGNVSIKILDVKLSDTGTYSCSLPSMQKEASIQLIVKPKIICSSEPVKAAVSEDVTLQCHFVNPVDATNMITEWRHESKNHTVLLNQDGHTSLFPEELTKGNLSLKISSVQLSDSGRYRCSVTSENLQHSCYVNLTVVPADNVNQTEETNDSSRTTNIGLIVGISAPLSVLILIVINHIMWRHTQQEINEAARGLNCCTGILDCSLCVAELARDD